MPDLRGRLRVAEDAARRAVGRLRTWFEPPVDADARPLEIREAIVDDVVRHAEPTAAGRRVLPYNLLTVGVLAEEKEDRAALAAALEDIQRAVCLRLGEIRCPVPAGFQIDLQFVKRPKPGWRAGQRFSVDYDRQVVARAAALQQPAPPELRIRIIRGQATQRSYTLTETHIRIGRTAAPTDNRGRPRVNHIAFAEEGDPHSTTVGRAHASIQYDAARREYRLFDDGSHNGTRVVRGGATLTVVAQNPVGVTILSGDELQFGTAAVTIEIGS